LQGHTQPLDQRIPDGPTAPSCTVEIDAGGGYGLLSSGLLLTSGARNGDGTLAGSAEFDDIGQYLQNTAGQIVNIRLTPGTDASNPFGAGRFQLSGSWFAEWSGIPVVRAS
jgi:hypothetical protein